MHVFHPYVAWDCHFGLQQTLSFDSRLPLNGFFFLAECQFQSETKLICWNQHISMEYNLKKKKKKNAKRKHSHSGISKWICKNANSNDAFPLLWFKRLTFQVFVCSLCSLNSPKNIDVKYINQFILWPVCLLDASKRFDRLLNCICCLYGEPQTPFSLNFYDAMPNKTQCTLVSLPLIIIYEQNYYLKEEKKNESFLLCLRPFRASTRSCAIFA